MSLEAVRFVLTPRTFPRRGDFQLVRDEAFLPETMPVLRAFAPGARFLDDVGAVPSRGALQPGASLVVSSRDWDGAVARLLDHQIEPERILVLVNPDDDVWGWLTLARACPDRLGEVVDPSVPLGQKISLLKEHISRVTLASFEGSRPNWFPDCYFHPFQDRVEANLETIHDMMLGLADRQSRETVLLLLHGSPEDYLRHFLANAFLKQQYTDCILLGPGDNIINAGVASGWDIPLFQSFTRNRGRHILVEPMAVPERFSRPPFEVLPYSLWDKRDTLTFSVGEGGMLASGQAVSEANDGPVQTVTCVPLDEVVDDLRLDKIDLIKMDIEGAEPRALDGMKETLVRYRPQLALAIYHEPEHMWTLPSMLMKLLPDYRFFIRHYGMCRFECVLYAIPAERGSAAA